MFITEAEARQRLQELKAAVIDALRKKVVDAGISRLTLMCGFRVIDPYSDPLGEVVAYALTIEGALFEADWNAKEELLEYWDMDILDLVGLLGEVEEQLKAKGESAARS